MISVFSVRRAKTTLIFLVCLLFVLRNNAQNRDISYLSSGGKLHPLQAIMDIRHYTITLGVDINNKTIQGNTEIDILLTKSTDTLLLDLVHLLQVKKVKVNNKTVTFFQSNDKIYITTNKAFEVGSKIFQTKKNQH